MNPVTCLLIDDDPDDQEFFSLALKELHPPVICEFANNGIEGIEKLQGKSLFSPHYIFIDINMPRMNGVECLSEIKKIRKVKNTPVFLYSTSADPKMVNESKKLGAADFIVKPIGINDLVQILKQCFKNTAPPIT
jgi:CheY-like chemotaxis protein